MKKLLLFSIFSIFLLALPKYGFSTHVAGGEITYQNIGSGLSGDTLLLKLTLYRDCGSGFNNLGSNQTIRMSSSCTSAQNISMILQGTGGDEVSQICPAQISNSQCNGGTLPGMEKYEYLATVILTTSCADYTFQYRNANRNSSVNVFQSSASNFYVEATYNSVLYPNNSSPEYTAPPIPYVCASQTVNYNYGVVENDGDSLSYALVSARRANGTNWTLSNLTYNTGYSATAPFPGITINSSTGELNFTPGITAGNYIVVVTVTEYNGAGQPISTVQRDIQFVVISCSNNVPTIPTTITNFVSNSGSASLTDTLEITASVGDDFCFDVSFSDANPNDTLFAITNATSALPGSIATITGTNPVTVNVCWTVPPGMNTNNTVTYQASDSACPVSGVNSLAVQVIVNQPPVVTGALTTTDLSCNGACDGTASVVMSGGVGPYSYGWYPNPPPSWCCQGLSSISGMCAGTYILIVTDLGDPDPSTNTWDTTFAISDAPPMAIIPGSIVDDDCGPTCTGSISAFAFGGTAPRTFNWSNGSSGQLITGLCAGTYTLTVTDANGCSQTQDFEIFEPIPPTIVVDSVDSVTCFGGSDGAIYITAQPTCGPSTAVCSSPSSVQLGANSTINTNSTYPSPYGNVNAGARHQYLFTAAELAAAGVQPGVITSLAFEVATIGNSINFANYTIKMGCTSASDLTGGWESGLIEVYLPKTKSVSTGWNTHVFDQDYFWDGVSNLVFEVCFNNPTGVSGGNSLVKYTATTNQSVRYYADNTSFVCSSNALTATSTNRPNVRFGNCASTFTYAWAPSPASSQTTPTVTGLTAQDYIVTVTHSDGCFKVDTITVNEPTEIDPVITLDQAISCAGQCDASISVTSTGGQAPYTYAWSNGGTGTNQTNLCAGAYTVSVTDAKGCTVTESITIIDPPTITATGTVVSPISCFGDCDGEISITASGGTAPLTISWPSGATGATQTGLCPNTYVVTITDAAGCFITESVDLVEPTLLTLGLSSSGSLLCNGDNNVSITSTVNGGTPTYSYLWSNSATTANLTNVGAGTYSLTVTDSRGCTADTNIVISEPPAIVLTLTQTAFILCNGNTTGQITASATGGTPGFTFAWNTGASGAVLSGIGTGTYTVTVTDANGCTETQSLFIAEPDPIVGTEIEVTPVSCNAACDGVATVSVSGGTAPYTLAWPGSLTVVNDTAINICGGATYAVTITDANGCVQITNVNMVEPTLLTANIVLDQGISCGGVCDAQITAVPGGGTAPYTFAWFDGTTTAVRSNLCAGTYSVTITDANGCTATNNINISQPAPVVASIAQTGSILCYGDQTVTLTGSATGGTAPFSYAWSNSVNTAINSNVGAGNYTVTVTDLNGCSDDETIVITGPDSMTVTTNIDVPVSCNGVCDGEISISTTGGTPGYTYAWSNGGTGTNQTNLCGGLYTITVTDANGCTKVVSIDLIEPAPIVLTSTINQQISCNGVCDASATVSASGGSAPITFAWPMGAGATQSNLCAGTYTVTATDANGCSNTIDVLIIEPAVLTLSLTETASILCAGDSTGSITSTVGGGTAPYTYLWNTGATTANLTNVPAGTYSLTVTDAGNCTKDTTITLTEPSLLTIAITETASILCNGDATGELTANATGGVTPYTFVWSNTVSGAVNSGLSAGSFSVTVTDANGCTKDTSYVLSEPTPIVANPTIISNIVCAGTCSGSATMNPSGGTAPYTISWPAGVTVSNDTATSLCGATTYIVTISDANGCQTFDTITLTEPTVLVASLTLDQGVSCGGVCDAQLSGSATGGAAPYTYAWSNGVSGQTIFNLCAGTYTLTVTDANNCTDDTTIVITEPNPIVASIGVNGSILCFGDSTVDLTTTVTGGTLPYTYSWSNGATSANLTSVGAGNYFVTITDANSCSVIVNQLITQPTDISLSVNITNPVSCNGVCDGAATIIASGGTPGFTVAWPGGLTGVTQTALCGIDYVVTVTDANGCFDTITVSMTNPNSVTASVVVNSQVSCFGACDGDATVVPAGGTAPYTIAWPGGLSGGNQTNLCEGSYAVTVSDANGCSVTETVIITEPSALTLGITQNTFNSCFGDCNASATAVATGGTAPYVYVWPGNDTTDVKTSLCAGAYVVTVTDANGCTTTQSILISEPAALTISTAVTNPISCNNICDGEITVSASGGSAPYTFVWDDGMSVLVKSNLCAGTYSVTVTDANGCTNDTNIILGEPAAITTTETITNATCGVCDGAISLTGTAGGDGGPYTYAWSTGGVTDTVINLCPGTYTVTITDGSGCDTVLTYPISNASGPSSAGLTKTNPTCAAACDGTLSSTPVGGATPYTFAWSTGATTNSISGLCAGVYFVTVTDASGCVFIATDTIVDPAIISNAIAVTDASCYGQCDGEITLTTAGGTPGYTYAWSSGGTSASETNLCAGTYFVTTTDANACFVIDTIVVGEPIEIDLNFTITDVTCFGNCDGTATVNPSGGALPYTFNWSDGQTTAMATNLCPGTIYEVTVTDANGCQVIGDTIIGAPAAIVISNVVVTDANCGLADGSISVTVSGGTAPYIYAWNGVVGTSTLSNAAAGIYNLVVTDANGCTQTSTIPLNNIGGPTVSLTATDVPCSGDCVGTATATVSGGTAPYTYAWSNLDTSAMADTLCAGPISVVITDANGCIVADTITIIQVQSLVLTLNSTNNTFCGGVCDGTANATVTGQTGNVTYAWSNGQGGDNLTGLCAGTYVVTATDASGCSAIDSVTITDLPALSVAISSITDAACANTNDGAVQLQVTGGIAPYQFSWVGPNGFVSLTQDIQFVLGGTYIVTVTDTNGCVIVDTAEVGIISNLAVVLNDVTFCDNPDTLVLNPTVTGGGAPFTFQWYNVNGSVLGNDSTLSVLPPTDTTYYVVEVISGGCSAIDTGMVAPGLIPDVDAGVGETIVKGQQVTLGGNPTTSWGGSTFAWSPSVTLNDATVANPVATPLETTLYTVTVTNIVGCSNSDTILITVNKRFEVISGFSPNADGVNDVWDLDFLSKYPSAVVSVYNRWGELIFQSDDGYTTPWDGTFEGEPIPVGTYYYVIDLKDGDYPDPLSGPITIMR